MADKLILDAKGNPFENMDKEESFYLNLGLMVSAYCNGDYDEKMPCTGEEWDAVVKYEIENNIPPAKSLTKWLEVCS